MRHRLALVLLGGALVVALAGCAAAPGTAPTTPAPLVSSTEPALSADGEPAEYPSLDDAPWEQTADDAIATATAVVTTYLASDSPTWWADLAPLLSPAAVAVYEQVDPEVIPAADVTGTAQVLEHTGDLLATVRVPTTVGQIDVLLTRATTDVGGWQVEQITPAAS